jgi:hypothetical protein
VDRGEAEAGGTVGDDGGIVTKCIKSDPSGDKAQRWTLLH